jgi:hypothetical protein
MQRPDIGSADQENLLGPKQGFAFIIFGSGPLDYSQQVPTHRFTTLLDFAVRQYPLVAVDLPGTLDNRVERRSAFSLSDIERIIQASRSLPAARRCAGYRQRSPSRHRPGRIVAALQQIERIADDMLDGRQIQKKSNVVRRFVEYFSVSPAREGRRS